MKTKLTLTVEKEIVEEAKLKAASRGVSLSRMFEEIFEKEIPYVEKTPEQLVHHICSQHRPNHPADQNRARKKQRPTQKHR